MMRGQRHGLHDDVHQHILPDFFFEATNETAHPVGGVAPAPWSKEWALSF